MELSPELEHLNAILGTRKEALDKATHQYLTFSLGNEEYGVGILRVQEITRWVNVTLIPNTPDYVCGLVNLRGEILPVVDLRLKLGMVKKDYSLTTVVIILKVTDQLSKIDKMVGIVVDAVSDTHIINAEDIKPPPDFGQQVNTAYMNGLVSIADKMMMILDVDALLGTEALV